MKSIRQRLLLWQLGALVIAAALEGFISYQLAWDGFNRSRDSLLQSIAYSVVRHGMRPAPDHASPPAPAPNPPDGPSTDLGHFTTQIWTSSGRLIYSSLAAGGPPLQSPGLNVASWNGEDWRIYTLVEREQVVQVAVTAADRLERFGEILPGLLAPLGVLVLVIWLLMHAAVRNALAPLNAWGRDLRRRQGDDLRAVGTQALPEELVPLGEALNQLLSRVQALLGSQRTLLADVAHELRTPLARIRALAEDGLAQPEVSTTSQTLQQIASSAERAGRLVNQLLDLAVADEAALVPRRERVALPPQLGQAVLRHLNRADARGIDLGALGIDDGGNGPVVCADAALLDGILDNLIDNALRYGGTTVNVVLRVDTAARRAEIAVEDDGPGLQPAEREALRARWTQGRDGLRLGQGAGLGLAIVARYAQLLGSELRLDEATSQGGLRASVTLPLA